MISLILLSFIATLFFLITAWRMVTYIQILVIQGIMLFALAYLSLSSLSTVHVAVIMLETVIIKTVAIPAFLAYILRRNGITRETEPLVPVFISLVLMVSSVILIFLLSYASGQTTFEDLFFVVSFITIFTGLYIIMTRRKIITHVMGFLVIENGVFILSLAVGNEMPMLINMGIMLDVFASVLTLGIFLNRIGDVFKDGNVMQLRNLKD